MFGVVVCYYSKPTHPASTKASVCLTLSLLKQCAEVQTIVLSDGSQSLDPELSQFCENLGIKYLHHGRECSFAETYNLGAQQLSEEWIALVASDIYVYPQTFKIFKDFIEDNPNLNIGCLIPFLSSSDFFPQVRLHESFETSFRVPVMTLNLNVMKRSVFDKIGGVPAQFSGAYNDVVMSIKMHDLGLDLFLVKGAFATHYGTMTVSSGTNYRFKKDAETFQKDFPDYVRDGTPWGLRMNALVRKNLKLTSRFFEKNTEEPQSFSKWMKYVLSLYIVKRFCKIPKTTNAPLQIRKEEGYEYPNTGTKQSDLPALHRRDI